MEYHSLKKTKTHKCQQLALLVVLLVLATQPGCQLFNRFKSQPRIEAPIAFTQQPTKEQIIQRIASQSQNVEQLQTDVRVAVDGMPTLRGNLAIEKPNRLRLNAGLLGVTELGIDVGSNEDVFWFWTKVSSPGQEPGFYFAKHNEYKNSTLQRTIPIQPEWLIDALGLIQFEPGDQVTGPFTRPTDELLELRIYRTVGNQKTLRGIVIDPQYGWVVQQSIYDANGRLMAYANSDKHEHYPEFNLSLPSRINFTAYDPDGNKIVLKVTASRFKINSIYGDPNQLWSMPNPQNVPVFDLVNGPRDIHAAQSNTASSALQIRNHRTSSNDLRRNRSLLKQLR